MKYSILHILTFGDETEWSRTQPDEDQVTSWVGTFG